jgi:transposase
METLSRAESLKLMVANQLQDKEIRRLQQKLVDQSRELARLRGDDERQAELAMLKELEALKPSLKANGSTGTDGKPPEKPEKPKQRGHGPTQQDIPARDVEHELSSLQCEACGEDSLEEIGSAEESEEISIETSRVIKLRHLRKKYVCKCGESSVITAPGPVKLVKGGRYSLEFATHVAVSKMVDHLPLQRQSRMLRRQGVKVSAQSMWDQFAALAKVLEPTADAIKAQILSSDYLHADETGFLLTFGKKKQRLTLWSISTPDLAWYTLGRKNYAAGEQLLGSYEGIVVADGYRVYEQLAARAGPMRLAHCWAHVLRKFRDAHKHRPAECEQILDLLSRLYEVEREAGNAQPDDLEHLALMRDAKSAPLLREIKKWALAQNGLPRSDFIKAVKYMLARWDGLTRFLEDPRLPLDNNAAERCLRGPVVGRKNWLQFRSMRGCRAGATLFSLCESAKLSGADPLEYLRVAATRAIEEPGTVTLPSELALAI